MIRAATSADHPAIRAVVVAAFRQPNEADLVDALRRDGDVLVELVAVEAGEIIGHILFTRLAASTGAIFAALAPLSVTPGRQRRGKGLALMEAGHAACREQGVAAIMVLGHPGYYPRAGYSAEAAREVAGPFSGPSFMALALEPAALDAPVTITYARAFGL